MIDWKSVLKKYERCSTTYSTFLISIYLLIYTYSICMSELEACGIKIIIVKCHVFFVIKLQACKKVARYEPKLNLCSFSFQILMIEKL